MKDEVKEKERLRKELAERRQPLAESDRVAAKQAEEALREQEQELSIRNRIAEIFLSIPDDEIYGEVLQVVLDTMGSDYGIFGYIDENNALVCPSMTRDIWDKCQIPDKDIVFPREAWGGIWGRALIEKRILCSNEPLRVPQGHIPILRALVVPIIYKGEVIGIFEVANKATDYKEKDEQLLGTIADSVAPILHARLNRGREEKERKWTEKKLQASYRFLMIANRYTDMAPLLSEFLLELKKLTGCEAAAMRILDQDGNIPYQVYDGFSEAFYRLESPLSIKTHKCMCINVIKGTFDPKLTFYTKGGSFFMNGTTRFLATVSEEDKGQTRNICNQFGYESVALVPIRSGDHILGLIHLADPRENVLPLELVEVIEWSALELGTAIRRVRAGEALRQAHDELEDRVEKRTRELVRANAKLKRSEDELRLLSSQLLNAQERERRRIARELHDGIGQSLSAIKFKLEDTWEHSRKRTVKTDDESFGSTISLIQNTVEEVRRITMDLRPSTLDDLGILATIAWFSREFQKIYSGIAVEREIGIEENDVPESLKIIIFRVLQEALSNAAKHSEADVIYVRLSKTGGDLELVVEDNGKGFAVKKALSVDNSKRGFGLGSMRERTELSGGTFVIDSLEGGGTIVRASWPHRGFQSKAQH